jgi:L-threonylcarbamoyladenylate synthase
VFIIDGGSCSIGIESTVLKITRDSLFNLVILRKGGVSLDNLKEALDVVGLADKCTLTQVAKKHYVPEDNQLEAPGQFLRHYSPDIVSFLYTGEGAITRDDISLTDSVLIDFGSCFADHEGRVKYYYDLSPGGDFL